MCVLAKTVQFPARRLRDADGEDRYALYAEPVDVYEAHAKCEREGGQLAVTDANNSNYVVLMQMYMIYRYVHGGGAFALVAVPSMPHGNCLVMSAGSETVENPCDTVGVPICKMNT